MSDGLVFALEVLGWGALLIVGLIVLCIAFERAASWRFNKRVRGLSGEEIYKAIVDRGDAPILTKENLDALEKFVFSPTFQNSGSAVPNCVRGLFPNRRIITSANRKRAARPNYGPGPRPELTALWNRKDK